MPLLWEGATHAKREGYKILLQIITPVTWVSEANVKVITLFPIKRSNYTRKCVFQKDLWNVKFKGGYIIQLVPLLESANLIIELTKKMSWHFLLPIDLSAGRPQREKIHPFLPQKGCPVEWKRSAFIDKGFKFHLLWTYPSCSEIGFKRARKGIF